MFLDEAEVDVVAGRGGNGLATFRREKFVLRGGPSGGHGGRGGDVVLVADEGLNTLYAFRYTTRFLADNGGPGGPNQMHGANGALREVKVPVGTVIHDAATGETIGDLTVHGQRLVVAAGGRGGRGNVAFKNSVRQAPRFAEKGFPGQQRRLRLELKLIADVGLIGMPNAGKSTLLAVVSAARPKIADYPFTTLVPNLGVVELGEQTLVLADVPGLVAGASKGRGLGDRFLRHVDRTRILVHLLDGSAEDPIADLRVINAELAAFSPRLAARPQLVVVNKIDLPGVRERWPDLRSQLAEDHPDAMAISGATGEGVRDLLWAIAAQVRALPAPEPTPISLPVLRPEAVDAETVKVELLGEGHYRLTGERVEVAAEVTDWDNEQSIARFQRLLDTMGARVALREAGVVDGDIVAIGEVVELEWVE